MKIGQTQSTMSMDEILTKYSEVDILSTFFNIDKLPCCIHSPLRNDKNPSFQLYLTDTGHVRFLDYATGIKGGIFDLLMMYWGCSFPQVLEKLCHYLIDQKNISIRPKHVKVFTKHNVNNLTTIQVIVRQWKDYDLEYWKSYGIDSKWLRYAEVYPISHKIVTKKESIQNSKQQFIFLADKYAYVYIEKKDRKIQLKIYQPYNTKGFKWCNKMDSSVISLWTKIPKYGDKLIICSSLKDALCLRCQLGIPTIALQGEGYNISDTAINELKRRYEKVFISFDVDTPGLMDGEKLSKETGFINIVPDLWGQKDYSDAYKSLINKEDFKQLKKLFD